MLNDDASSMDFDQVYDARNWTPWLKRFCRLTSSALHEAFAMLAISPLEEKIQLLGGSLSVHPAYRRRWLALPEFEIGWPFTYPGTNSAGFPSMKRGRCVPLVPTYAISNRKSLPIERCKARSQSCV